MSDIKKLLIAYYSGDVSLEVLSHQVEQSCVQDPSLLTQLKQSVLESDNGSPEQKQRAADLVAYLQEKEGETIIANNDATRVQPGASSQQTPPAFDASQQRTLVPGDILKDRFILEEVIGTGGMSVVFKARDIRKEEAKDQNPHVAMKVLGHEFKEHTESFMVLQRETQKAQKLAHPNIVTVYDFDRDGDTIYMTMECLHGKSLDQVIREHPQGMMMEEATPIISGMSLALAYAHKKDIIHSDFKPGNVFITDDGIIKVLDFGIARAKNVSGDFDAGQLGALTPTYASCEMFDGVAPDPKDDIYALACISYELLTGKHPFNRMPANQAREQGLEPKRIVNLSRRRWLALRRGLMFSPDSRTATVEEFLQGICPGRLSMGLRISLGLVLLMAISTGYFYYQMSQAPEFPIIELSVEEQFKIDDYLETAELYMELGQLATPPGDSAFDLYDAVLAIDLTNQVALDGKEKIAQRYFSLAKDAFDSGDIKSTLSYVDTGLQVQPSHEGLIALKLKLKH